MLKSVVEMILCFLFLGDNVPGCCYYQRYQNREICKTSQSEYAVIISSHNLAKVVCCYVRIFSGMQIGCQALSRPISLRDIFALQKMVMGTCVQAVCPITGTHKCINTHTQARTESRSEISVSELVCVCVLSIGLTVVSLPRVLAGFRRELQNASAVICHCGVQGRTLKNLLPSREGTEQPCSILAPGCCWKHNILLLRSRRSFWKTAAGLTAESSTGVIDHSR